MIFLCKSNWFYSKPCELSAPVKTVAGNASGQQKHLFSSWEINLMSDLSNVETVTIIRVFVYLFCFLKKPEFHLLWLFMVFNFFLGTSHLKNFMWKPVMMEQMTYLSLTVCPRKLPCQVVLSSGGMGWGQEQPRESLYRGCSNSSKRIGGVSVCGSEPSLINLNSCCLI